jgi:hypothetical protein
MAGNGWAVVVIVLWGLVLAVVIAVTVAARSSWGQIVFGWFVF